MKMLKWIGFFLGLSVSIGAFAEPQEDSSPHRNSLFDRYQARALEDKDGRIVEVSGIRLLYSGLLQLQYMQHSDELDRFRVRRGEVKIEGEPLEKIFFVVNVDPTRKDNILNDLQLKSDRIPYIKLTLGQMKLPMSLEGLQSSGNLETLERAIIVTKLGEKRDIGLKIDGEVTPLKLKYALGVFNGEGANSADTNDQKDLAGMLIWQPLDSLSMTSSFYEGNQGIHSETKRRYGAGLRYNYHSFLMKGEYLEGQDASIETDGWYVLVGYRLNELGVSVLEPVELVARYEEWTPNRDDDDALTLWTVGGSYFIDPKYSKLQLNGIFIDGQGDLEDSTGVSLGWELKF